MIIDEKNIKTWSLIGPRATFGLISLELAKKYEDLIILTSDVSTSAGLDRFKNQYKNQYIDVGIAEQNLMGIAAGLSSEGYKVITTTFSPFQTLRCCEQIKVNLSYMKNKVIMVGLASGVVLGTLGYTHCSIEDVSIIRSIPNIDIISPSDSLETAKALFASMESDRSCYIRLTGGTNNPIVNKTDYKFQIGKAIYVNDCPKPDAVIIATGSSVAQSLEASKLLKKDSINLTVLNMHTINPLDHYTLEKISKKNKLIFTAEEHSLVGGLYSAISDYYSKNNGDRIKIVPIAHPHNYGKGGEYKYLLSKYGLDSEGIRKKVVENIKI